jgi:transcriptional regulator with XRE-family HTH domain
MSVETTLFELWKQKEAEWNRTITIAEVASKTDISRATLIRLRQGKTSRPDLEVIGKLCKFFNVPPGPVPFLVYEPGD